MHADRTGKSLLLSDMACCLPWGALSLILFLLLQPKLYLSSGCFVEERAALMDIRSSLMTASSPGAFDSWGEYDDDCCSWELVKCNNSTQRVSDLYLKSVYAMTDADADPWYINLTVFSAFHELEYLDLSWNYPCSLSSEGFVGLSKLQYLDLSTTSLVGGFPEIIGKIVSLEVLALNFNDMAGVLPAAGLVGLSKLRYLDLSYNAWEGGFPEFLGEIVSLEYLVLNSAGLTGGVPATALKNLRNLQQLNMSSNGLNGSLPASLFTLPHLKILDLSDNNFSGHIPVSSSLGPISLEVLDLSSNCLNGTLPVTAVENLLNLRELYLGSNQFSGSIPTLLFSLPQIERVNLSTNFFGGPIPINPSSNLLSPLKSLRLSQNNLSGRLSFFSLGNLTKLEEMDLSGNANLAIDVSIPEWTPLFQLKQLLLSGCDLDKSIIVEPHFLQTQRHLEVLDLSNNNLLGSMPNWLFTKEATLQELYLGNNSLTGSLGPIWHTQSFLKIIRIHTNHVMGQLPTNIGTLFPMLRILDFSTNNFSGHIPPSLCEMSHMQILDVSSNKLSGEVPACVFSSCLDMFRVSNNKLGGLIFAGVNSRITIEELYLDRNKFEGTIPHNLSGDFSLMDLHDNKLSGGLDASLWNVSSLGVLNLAGNRIMGKIHRKICGITRLRLLDLSSNNLTGSLPNCSFLELQFLNLSRNSLSGDFPYTLFNMISLDIRHNKFTGNLHWISYLDNVRLLSLGRNKFEGQITPNLCKLLYLRIIDLSHNMLSGSLPSCIGNISFKGDIDDQIFQPVDGISIANSYYTSYDLRDFTFSTKGNLYTYGRSFFVSMSGIDLSANMLDGQIPWELGNLSHIKSLNLSNNFFVGPIPTTFGGMEEIESLDLSHNKLSGPIPRQLTQLSSLGVFSVAYNNLSGCIPSSGQLGSFSMDSYLPNTNLHQITQGNMCAAPDPVSHEDVGETPSDPALYDVTSASFVLGFWAIVTFSFCHPYGRSVMLKL